MKASTDFFGSVWLTRLKIVPPNIRAYRPAKDPDVEGKDHPGKNTVGVEC
jgi:hypothetical protein